MHSDRAGTSSFEIHLNKSKTLGYKTLSANNGGLRPGKGGLWGWPVILAAE